MQESYCYQIFLDQNHSLVLPTVQQLLEHSFHHAGLKLAEVRLLHHSVAFMNMRCFSITSNNGKKTIKNIFFWVATYS